MANCPLTRRFASPVRRLLTVLAPLIVLIGAGPAGAVTRTVSFDDLPDGTTVQDQYMASHGVFFKTGSFDGGALPIVRSNPGQAHSPSNLADISNCPGCEFYTPRSVAHLNPTARGASAFVGFVGPGSPHQMTMIARDSSFAPIATDTVTVTPGDPFNAS